MNPQESEEEGWPLIIEENDPSPDLSREDAAFERKRARLLREHPGQVAVVLGDEVVGVYKDANVATIEARQRFGRARLVFYLIEERGEPEWIANVDTTHPSFKPLD